MKRQWTFGLVVMLYSILFSAFYMADDLPHVPQIVYTDDGQYGYTGNRWDCGEGVAIILPYTGNGEWMWINEDISAGILGGVCSTVQNLSVTVYSGTVSYEPTLEGVYNYVLQNGYTDVMYAACNDNIVVQFSSQSTYEKNIAFPYNEKIIQVTVMSPDNSLREQFAQWIFSATYPASGKPISDHGKYQIIAKASEGVAIYSDPDNHFDIAARVPYMEKVDVTDIQGDYGYTSYNGGSGWLNLKYASRINDDGSVTLTANDAYLAVYNYFDQHYNILTVYNYNGYVILGEETPEDYVVQAKSYTGARAYYYVNKNSGDVYEQWISPITNEPEALNYAFSVSEGDIPLLRTKQYEYVTEDGYYYSTMSTRTNGKIDVLTDAYCGCLCEYDYSGNYFITYGSANYNYERSVLSDIDHVRDCSYRAYIFDESTTFVAISGESEPRYFSVQDFLAYANQCKDTGLGFTVRVLEGKAVEIGISS